MPFTISTAVGFLATGGINTLAHLYRIAGGIEPKSKALLVIQDTVPVLGIVGKDDTVAFPLHFFVYIVRAVVGVYLQRCGVTLTKGVGGRLAIIVCPIAVPVFTRRVSVTRAPDITGHDAHDCQRILVETPRAYCRTAGFQRHQIYGNYRAEYNQAERYGHHHLNECHTMLIAFRYQHVE